MKIVLTLRFLFALVYRWLKNPLSPAESRRKSVSFIAWSPSVVKSPPNNPKTTAESLPKDCQKKKKKKKSSKNRFKSGKIKQKQSYSWQEGKSHRSCHVKERKTIQAEAVLKQKKKQQKKQSIFNREKNQAEAVWKERKKSGRSSLKTGKIQPKQS